LLEGLKRQETSVLGAEDDGKWLTDNCPQDRSMRPGVREELSKMHSALDAVEAKLQDRLNKLNNAVMQGQEFDESFSDINDKLGSMDFQTKRQKPVSPVWPETVKQQQEQNDLVKEMAPLKKLYDRLMKAADKVVDTLEDGEEKDQTVEKVNDMKKKWDDINEKIDKRDKLLDEIEPLAKDHHDKKQPFDDWLTEAETSLKDLEPVPTTVEEYNKLCKAVKDFVVDVEDHIPEHNSLNETLEALDNQVNERPEECDKTNKLKEETDKLNKRWDKLEATSEKCKSKVEKLREPLKKFSDDTKKTSKALDDIERSLEYEPLFGIDSKQGKDELQRIEDLCSALEPVKEDVVTCTDDAKELEAVVDEFDGDTEDVKEKASELPKRLADLEDKLRKRKDDVEKKNKVVDQFQNRFDDLENGYLDMVKKLNDIGPVKQSPEDVKAQLEELKKLEDELNKARPNLNALEDASDWLVDNNSDDKVTTGDIKARYASIATPISQLADKINEKQNRLNQALVKTLEFEDIFATCTDQLEELAVRFERMEPLSVKHNNLQKQDDAFKAYETDFTQLQPVYEEMVKAVKGVKENTEDPEEKERLVKKVKDVVTKRVDLAKRVQERRQEIDKLLPLAAKEDKADDAFKPDLTSLEEQCEKTKEVPQTLDDCKKQLKEVEAIKKGMQEASPKHEELNDTYNKEIEYAKTLPKVSDEPILTNEVDDLNKRWDELKAQAKDKEDQVGKLHDKFKKYNDSLVPVEEELTKCEAVLDQQQPIGLDEEKGKKNMDEIDELLKEIEDTEKKVKDVDENGKDLADELDSYDADGKPVKEKVAEVDERLEDIKKKLKDRKDDIAKQMEDLKNFKDTEKDLQSVLDDVTEKQDNLEPISLEPETIKEQLAEVQNMLDEIDSCKPKVDKLGELGKDVCDNNPGDFSVASETALDAKKIEEPLERAEFKLNDRKNKLEKLLVGSQELQDTIDDFNDKLMAAEKNIGKLKPVSARYVVAKMDQATIKQLLDQISQLEPNLETLEEAASKVIKEAEPKERDQVQKKVDDLKSRFDEARDAIKEKQEVVEKVVPLAKTFEEQTEPVQEFITEAEKTLAPVTDDVIADKQALSDDIDKLKVSLIFLTIIA